MAQPIDISVCKWEQEVCAVETLAQGILSTLCSASSSGSVIGCMPLGSFILRNSRLKWCVNASFMWQWHAPYIRHESYGQHCFNLSILSVEIALAAAPFNVEQM
eukprot:c26901_g1_i1 orf=69-380(+)